MKAGMSLREREATRQRYIDAAVAAVAKATLIAMSLRCRSLQADLNDPGHRYCMGEQPGNSGCLCRCHDISAATRVISRKDEQ